MKKKTDAPLKTLEQMTPKQLILMAEDLSQLSALAMCCRQSTFHFMADQLPLKSLKNYLASYIAFGQTMNRRYAPVFAPLAPLVEKNPRITLPDGPKNPVENPSTTR